MSATRRSLSQALLALTLSALCAGCAGEHSDETWVAQVDGATIPLGELRRMLAEASEASPETRREDLLNDALNRLVSDQVVLNRAREIGVEVRDAEIDSRLRRLHGNDVGTIDARYREDVRRQMTMDRAMLFDLAEQARVSEEAVTMHYEEHRDLYHEPLRVQIRQIVVEERAKADEIMHKLNDGANFAELAAEHSLAPEGGDGGLLPLFARGELPEAFDAAFELDKGISAVIESPYGFHIFKLVQRLEPRDPELPEVRERIALDLEAQRLEELRREWVRALRRKAELRVNDELLETLREIP